MSLGRPSKYTDELAREICTQLSEGKSLREICASEQMPAKSTILRWLFEEDKKDFQDQYTRAREIQADVLADDILHIADHPQSGVTVKTFSDGKQETREGDMIEHRRLQVDARKWVAAKLLPKKYSERQSVEHSGEVTQRVAFSINGK